MKNVSDVKIDDAKLADAISKATLIQEKVGEALQKAQLVNNKLHGGAVWSGEAKDSCAAYLDIVVKYHKDIEKGLKKHEKVLKDLKKNIKNFEASGEVQAVKGL